MRPIVLGVVLAEAWFLTGERPPDVVRSRDALHPSSSYIRLDAPLPGRGRLLPGLRYCYEKTLVAVPTLAGDVSISLTVGQNGKVADAVLSGLDDPDLSPCLKKAVKNYPVRDSKSAGKATVSFILRLRTLPPPAPN